MSRRRALAATTAVAAVLLVATGCSSTGSTPKPTATSKPSGSITLNVGSWWEPQVPTIMTAWNQDHPEIELTINPTPINGYLDKFTASALGGSPPDIIDLNVSWLPSVASKNLLEPLTDVADQVDVKDYAPGPWEGSQFKGIQYGMPDRSSTSIVFYNETLFDNAGLAYPTSDWTYSDMLATAQKLTVAGSQYGIGIAADLSDPANAMESLSTMIWGHGGDFLNKDETKAVINSPKSVAGLAYWADLYTKYKVTPPGTPGFATTRDLLPLFEANQLAMFIGGSANVAALDALPDVKYGTVLNPGNHASPSSGFTMAVPVGAKNPDAAKVFIQWFAQPKVMGTLMNRQPARLSSLAMPPWNDPKFDNFTEALKYGRSTPSVGSWTEMQTDIITDAQEMLVGKSTPQQAADKMQSQMTALLAQK